MKTTLSPLTLSWQITPTSEPFFSYHEQGLAVELMVFLGEQQRAHELRDYLKNNGLTAESDIPDDIYNNAGFRIAQFRFTTFDSLYCSGRERVAELYAAPAVDCGIYQLQGVDAEPGGYVFIGHSVLLTVESQHYTVQLTAL